MVFDLDETLIRSEHNFPIHGENYSAFIKCDPPYPNIYVYLRPFIDHLIKSVRPHFELVVFTAASSDYAKFVIEAI